MKNPQESNAVVPQLDEVYGTTRVGVEGVKSNNVELAKNSGTSPVKGCSSPSPRAREQLVRIAETHMGGYCRHLS